MLQYNTNQNNDNILIQDNFTENSGSQKSLSLSNSSSNNNNNQKQNSLKETEELFQFLVVDDTPQNEHIKVYNEQEWIQVIHGKSRKYTSNLEIKASLRQGIPRKLRPQIWFWLTEQKKLENQYSENLFDKLSASESKSDNIIQLDVDRTQVSTVQKQMCFKILRAYANFDAEIGYTQGMNYIVVGILYSLEILQTEQKKKYSYLMNKAFWILVYICFKLNWREVYKKKMNKTIFMLKDLDRHIKEKLPDIHQHMMKHGAEVTLCFCESFITILLQYSSVSMQKRILDLFLLEGEKLIRDMIIRILQLNKKEILIKNSMEDLVQFMKKDLMQHSFNNYKNELQKLFPMPQNEISISKFESLQNYNKNIQQQDEYYE